MRPNSVKRALKAGKPAVGTWLSLGSITAARLMARAGFDWLTLDMEHSLVGIETAETPSIADEHVDVLALFGGLRLVAVVVFVGKGTEVLALFAADQEGLGVEAGFESVLGSDRKAGFAWPGGFLRV